jgi:hypothetical protein
MSMLRIGLIGAALAAALMASTTPGAAQGTPEQRSACMGDAFRFCSAQIPSVPKVTACMKVNFSKLSQACQSVMMKGQ